MPIMEKLNKGIQMKKSMLFLSIILMFVFSGCGSSVSNLSKNDTNSYVKQTVVLYVKHTKDDDWIPHMMVDKHLYRNSKLIKDDLSDDISFVFKPNGMYVNGGFYCTLTDGKSCNCNKVRSKVIFCKYNTPFFDNGVMGVRITPGGIVDFNQNKTISYLKKYDVFQKMKPFSELVAINDKYLMDLYNLNRKAYNNMFYKISTITRTIPKPKINFIAENSEYKNIKFENKLEYRFSNTYVYAIEKIAKNYKTKPLYLQYLFANNIVKIYLPNNIKTFDFNNKAKIKDFIIEYYKKQKQNYLANNSKNEDLLKSVKNSYFYVTQVGCTKTKPCEISKGFYRYKYYYDIKPKDKIYPNKVNTIKVKVDKYPLTNVLVNKPNIIFEDKNLAIKVQNGKIKLINKTKSFIHINSLAEYIKDKIYDLGSYTLPPESEKTINSYHQIYADGINEKIFYGFAVSYKINNQEYSFYKNKTFIAKNLK